MKGALTLFSACLLLISIDSSSQSWDYSYPLIIDHAYTDISKIPAYRVDLVQQNIKLHYAHTSHGGQLTSGLNYVQTSDPSFKVAIGSMNLPEVSDAICVFDGQESVAYITPDLYWETESGMDMTRSVLNNNPTINASMWAWCTQLDTYTPAQVQAYLDSISRLESEYPGVIFMYMTGNAQATGSLGYRRYTNNEMIRQYCIDNNRVLYDFADLDSWWYNPSSEEWEHATYEYEGYTVPVEHPQFNGDEVAHTTYESCEQKGRALWWLLTRIEGGAAGDTLAVYEESWGKIKSLFK